MSLFVFMKYAEKLKSNMLYRQNAFTLLGVAHFNYNNIVRGRQSLERIILERKEKTMAEVHEIIEKIEEIARMLSGNSLTEEARKMATVLISDEKV